MASEIIRTVLCATLLVTSALANPLLSLDKDKATCSSQQYRHRYHFSPLRNWSNDPNGLVYVDGVYHLFFQYHPYSTQWGSMHWGHAISTDMLVWEEVDIALYPDDVGVCYSGSAVVDKLNTTGFKPPNSDIDPVIAIYTSTSGDNNYVQRQSIAVSLDNGMTFTKYPGNPVLSDPSKLPDFRDPKVSYIDGSWVMVLAVLNRVEFFSSPNLVDWTLESEFGRDEGSHGGTWECPDLLEMEVEMGGGERKKLFVLVVSVGGGGPNGGSGTHYFVGNFSRNADNNNRFEFHSFGWTDSQWLDWGPDNYAGVTFSNTPDNRHTYIAWMSNLWYAGGIPTSTWRGQFTIPRELTLTQLSQSPDQYRVISTPVRELQTLRNPSEHLEVTQSFRIPSQTVIQLTELATFSTPSMDLEISLNATNSPQFSICAYNEEESEEICFGHDGESWFLDRSRSGNTGFHDLFPRVAHAKRQVEDEVMNIRLLLDVSSFEVFADGGLTTMTALFYPTKNFDKFYINHWSRPSSPAVLQVNKIDLWGVQCWYPESE